MFQQEALFPFENDTSHIEGKRLLILACSDRKKTGEGQVPALERYDGPMWKVLRKHLSHSSLLTEQLDVYVLSAEFGLIPSAQPIPLYDRVMTAERARELQPQIQETLRDLLANGYTDICLALSQLYLPALEGWRALLSPDVSVTITDGPMATKSNQLRAWLQRETWKPTEYPPDYQLLAKSNPHKEVVLKGVAIRLTRDEIFEKARAALKEDALAATKYKDWYVLVDDTPVAPKWLVQLISGVSVRDFDASAARRVLGLLGVDVRRAH